MVARLPKKIMKTIYQILTSGSADIAFFTEAFVTGNKEWIMKKPIIFGYHLLKINMDCRVPWRRYMISGLAPGKKCIARIYRRPKVYQYAMALMSLSYIVTDLFGTLLEVTLDKESMYQKIEEEYQLSGFKNLRIKSENSLRTIESIYDDISRKLGVSMNKDMELSMLKRLIVVNPYIKQVLEIAAYNHIDIICILESSYSVEDIRNILCDVGIDILDIRVSNEHSKSFQEMMNDFVKSKDGVIKKEEIAVLSGNFNKVIKYGKRKHATTLYYRSAKEIMRSIPLPNLTSEFKEVYETLAGLELFSGHFNHKNLYESIYLYIAPIIYSLLDMTYQSARKSGATVIMLCDPESICSILYERHFGKLKPCIWTGFVGSIPATKQEWSRLIEDSCIVERFSADRLAYSLGLTFPHQPLKICKEEFIEVATKKARRKKKEIIKEYLKYYLEKEDRILVIDPMPGKQALSYFKEYAYEINPNIQMEVVSMSQFLNKDARELSMLYQILQMDTPFVTGVYAKDSSENSSSGLKELSFVQPKFMDEVKKKTIFGAMEDFFTAFVAYKNMNTDFQVCSEDMNEILNYSKEGLMQLLEELEGGAV